MLQPRALLVRVLGGLIAVGILFFQFHLVAAATEGEKQGKVKVVIDAPIELSTFTMQAPNYNQVEPISLQAHLMPAALNTESLLTWNISLFYTTHGGYGPGLEFISTAGQAVTSHSFEPFQIQFAPGYGGLLTLSVSAHLKNGLTIKSNPVHCFLTGTSIPASVLIPFLTSAYQGETPALLVGIASTESSLRQFTRETITLGRIHDIAAYPLESSGGGHIGLMQVDITQAAPERNRNLAWNWQYNIEAATNLFTTFALPFANLNMIHYQMYYNSHHQANQHPLLNLTPQQLEDNALCFYSGFLSADPVTNRNALYWVPNKTGTDWVVNYTTYQRNTGCYWYVNRVHISILSL